MLGYSTKHKNVVQQPSQEPRFADNKMTCQKFFSYQNLIFQELSSRQWKEAVYSKFVDLCGLILYEDQLEFLANLHTLIRYLCYNFQNINKQKGKIYKQSKDLIFFIKEFFLISKNFERFVQKLKNDVCQKSFNRSMSIIPLPFNVTSTNKQTDPALVNIINIQILFRPHRSGVSRSTTGPSVRTRRNWTSCPSARCSQELQLVNIT